MGQTEAALRQIEDGLAWLLCIAIDASTDERRHVEHQHARHVASQVGFGRQPVDLLELRLERRLAQLIGSRFDQERREEIAELLLIRSRLLLRRFGRTLDDGAETLMSAVDRFVEAAVLATVGGNLRLLQPRPIYELVEVVLLTDGLVEARHVNS